MTAPCQQPQAHGFQAFPPGKPVNCDKVAHHETSAPEGTRNGI